MRSAGNFHPVWGCMAPAPSFVRTFRNAIVATAVGATAGAGAVLSLVDAPAPAETSIAAHTLVHSIPAAPARGPQPVKLASIAVPSEPAVAPSLDRVGDSAADQSQARSTGAPTVSVAALDEASAATPAPPPKPTVEASAPAKKPVKKRSPSYQYYESAYRGSYRESAYRGSYRVSYGDFRRGGSYAGGYFGYR
jgi:hypothetical protein